MFGLLLTLQLTHTAATAQDRQMLTPRAQTNTQHPRNSSALPCSNRLQCQWEGKGEIRTSDPVSAVRLWLQLDFQAAQATEWAFGVSFL